MMLRKLFLMLLYASVLFINTYANFPFNVGEKFKYDLSWSFFNAGQASLEIVRDTTFSDSTIVFEAISNSADYFSAIYYVKNINRAYYDFVNEKSLRTEKSVHENSYRANKESVFNYEDSTVVYKKTRFKKKKTKIDTTVAKIDTNIMDMLSAFYHIRTLPLKVDSSIFLKGVNDGEMFELKVDVLRKKKVNTIYGKVNCFVIQPFLVKGGLFEAKGDIYIYLTDDWRRIPVLLESEIIIGKIKAELVKCNMN